MSASTKNSPVELDLTHAGYDEKSHDFSNSSDSDHASTPIAPTFDKLATKKLLRKLDLHLIPFLALIYL